VSDDSNNMPYKNTDKEAVSDRHRHHVQLAAQKAAQRIKEQLEKPLTFKGTMTDLLGIMKHYPYTHLYFTTVISFVYREICCILSNLVGLKESYKSLH